MLHLVVEAAFGAVVLLLLLDDLELLLDGCDLLGTHVGLNLSLIDNGRLLNNNQ